VLFVDDEVNILRAVQRLLRHDDESGVSRCQ